MCVNVHFWIWSRDSHHNLSYVRLNSSVLQLMHRRVQSVDACSRPRTAPNIRFVIWAGNSINIKSTIRRLKRKRWHWSRRCGRAVFISGTVQWLCSQIPHRWSLSTLWRTRIRNCCVGNWSYSSTTCKFVIDQDHRLIFSGHSMSQAKLKPSRLRAGDVTYGKKVALIRIA